MSFFGQSKRPLSGSSAGSRRTAGAPLPLFDNSRHSHDKPGLFARHARRPSASTLSSPVAAGWLTVIHMPLPRFLSRSSPAGRNATTIGDTSPTTPTSHAYPTQPRRHIPLYLPIPYHLFSRLPTRLTPLKISLFLAAVLGTAVIILTIVTVKVVRGRTRHTETWGSEDAPFVQNPVLTWKEVGKVWQWEVLSGHHPSYQDVPRRVPFPDTFTNPSIPFAEPLSEADNATRPPKLVGSGPDRYYFPLESPLPPWQQPQVSRRGRSDEQSDSGNYRQQDNHGEPRKGEEEEEEEYDAQRSTVPGFPPRPVPGSVIDLDRVMEKCDYRTYQYVRDCLEFLRIGGNLDNGMHLRRENLSTYQHIYQNLPRRHSETHTNSINPLTLKTLTLEEIVTDDHGMPVERKSVRGLSRDPLKLTAPNDPMMHETPQEQGPACDPEYPRLFHMFWAGPFTDKPYMAVMSFLYTQNLGLDRPLEDDAEHDSTNDYGYHSSKRRIHPTCRPQFWVWINPGPAASVPNPSARAEMYESLAVNPWSAPFLHPRFQDVVKFKMWNTTDQMDGIDELRPHWRRMPIFNSGGNTYGEAEEMTAAAAPPPVDVGADLTATSGDGMDNGEGGIIVVNDGSIAEPTPEPAPIVKKKNADGIYAKVGSTSQNDYDRLSVILSDLARFTITHRYGGIYIDADTVFLRDWEELWNYKGQFAYRWSYHDKYNTAVLKLHKGSALGKFLFQAALENGLDFHPMTISEYLKDAGLEKLLYRLPDALFDAAWLNFEGHQRERPPFPYFSDFSKFFSNEREDAAGPQPLGFDGFFRGSFSYHFHNFWWLPFDPARNWPDLGKRFIQGERSIRRAARAARLLEANPGMQEVNVRADIDDEDGMGEPAKDQDDLSWSTVLKRTCEAYLRSERPNMYGEWLRW